MISRPLDTNESLFYVMDEAMAACRTAQAMCLRGPLRESELREAMRRLALLHPRLSCTIAVTPAGLMWEPVSSAPELRHLDAADVGAPAEVVARALKGASTRPLWWMEWAQRDDEHLVCLVLHHSLADGMSAAYLARALVDLINDVQAGRPEPSAITPTPPLDAMMSATPLPALVRHQAKTALERLRPRRPATLPFDGRCGPDGRETRVILDTLPAANLTALHERARREKTTVSGAITAALVSAIADTYGLADEVEVSTQVSLRAQCTPRLEQDVIGCYGGRVLTYHAPRQDLWRLARECRRMTRAAIDHGAATIPLQRSRDRQGDFTELFARAVANDETCGRTGPLAISSLGIIPASRSGDVRYLGFFPAIANHPAGACLQLSCGTLNGELHCTWMYVTPIVAPARAQAIWSAARARLEALR